MSATRCDHIILLLNKFSELENNLIVTSKQVSDYNIARHITNIHRLIDDALRPDYTTDQVRLAQFHATNPFSNVLDSNVLNKKNI